MLHHLLSDLDTILLYGYVGSIYLVLYWWAFSVSLTFHSYTHSCSGWGHFTFVLVTMMCLSSVHNWKHGQGLGLNGRVPISNAQELEYPPQYHNKQNTNTKHNRGIRIWYVSAKPEIAHVQPVNDYFYPGEWRFLGSYKLDPWKNVTNDYLEQCEKKRSL